MQIGLSLGFGWRYGTGGVAHGPTVQLAGVTTPLSLVHGTTGTFTATPKDISAVATGAQPYWHSSDPNVVRIDNATTGAYTVTGTAAQTVTITVDFLNSLAEPSYTGTGGQTALLIDDMSRYAGMSIAAMQTYSGAASYADRRLYPAQSSPYCQVVTGLGGTGTALKVASTNDENGGFSSGHFRTLPDSAPGSGAVLYLSHYITYDGTITQDARSGSIYNPLGYATRVKWLEAWHNDIATRAQWNTTDLRAAGATKATNWGQHDQAYSVSTANNGQVLGPWFDDIANDGLTHRFAYQYRSNTADTGTIDVLVQAADVVFINNQSGVLAVNQYVKLVSGAGRPGLLNPGDSLSAAEFKITAFDGDRTVHVVRQGSTGNTLTSPSGGVSILKNVTTTGTFSVNRASSTVATGRPIALPRLSLAFQVDAFDGTTGCTITQVTTDAGDGSAVQSDLLGRAYSTILDGISRMWVDGVLIHDISQEGIRTPIGGVGPYCALSDISTLAVNDGFWQIRFGEAQSLGPSYSLTFQNLKWWAVNA